VLPVSNEQTTPAKSIQVFEHYTSLRHATDCEYFLPKQLTAPELMREGQAEAL
jgi:hypothetical protein